MRYSKKIIILALLVAGVVLIYKFWGLQGPFAFLFILGAAVVLHEFGHFIVAKMFRIRVETFSVGFGPRLFGRKWGDTDYRVSAIPLGGYVKLGGDESNAAIEGAGESDIPPEEQFSLRPRWQKIAVSIAGPVMNVLTALAIPFIAGLLWGVPIAPTSPTINRIEPNSAAQVAGLQPGDRIVSFNGMDNPTWDSIHGDATVAPTKEAQPIPMVIERDGKRIPLSVTPKLVKVDTEIIGELGIMPDYGIAVPVTIGSVEKGSPAEQASLQPGDRLVAINGTPVRNRAQATQLIRENQADQVALTIEREGKQLEVKSGVQRIKDDQGHERARLGIGLDDVVPRQNVGLSGTARYAVNSNVEIMRLTGKALGQLFTGQRRVSETLSGPIGIARASTTAVEAGGWSGIFVMLGFLSLNLGVFNLLPIPVLDGGAIFLLLIEAVLGLIGVTLSMTMRERIQQVGFVVLLLLMGFVITNDLIKEASRLKSSGDPPAATAPQK
ncbi:MAG: RIP metalloprotease RseP [Pyrinomonadaceae bacterium]